MTPLHHAIRNGQTTVVKALLENGARFDLADKKGMTAIDHAGFAGWTEITKMIVEAEVALVSRGDANVRGRKPLHIAAFGGNIAQMKRLLQDGASVNLRDEKNATPLHYAAENGQEEAVLFLLSAGASPHIASDNWGTPLHQTAYRGLMRAVKAMLDKGADVNVVKTIGLWTPLHLAAMSGSEEMIKLLLKRGADTKARNEAGHTPIQVAQSEGQSAIVRVLQ
jgi:cytohesin